MLSLLRRACKSLAQTALGLSALALAACTPGTGPVPTVGGGSGKVQVALLVPGGSGQASDEMLAKSLQNAARMAISDLNGVQVDLRVYNTAGQPGQAASMATKAVAEGAQVILGPVYAQEANAAGVAVASSGVSVLAFSNNPDIAGNNVFVLGTTFDSVARTLGRYAVGTGKSNVMIVHDRTTAGEIGRAAIQRGWTSAGGSVVGTASYEFSQNGIVQAAPQIAAQARGAGAQAVFLTADTAGALPLISQLLSENGLATGAVQYVGLSRWDIPAATLSLPGVQGGLFALPDPGTYGAFLSRYQAAFGESPNPILSGLAYDGIAAIGALAGKAGGGPIPKSALTQGAGFLGVNGIFRLRSDGTNDRGLAVAQVTGGTYRIVQAAPKAFGGAGF